MLAALDPKMSWYVARAAGLVAWCMCSVSVIWGLLVSSRLVRRRGAPAWLLDLHRYLGTLAMVFTAIHLAGLWFDDYVTFNLRQLFVPLADTYRPVAVAWGVVAFYLLVAIQLSSWFMRRLPRRVWHAIHLTSIPLTVLATLHGFTAGADRSNLIVISVALVMGSIIVFLTGSRVAAKRAATPRARRIAGASGVAVSVSAERGGDARTQGIERARESVARRQHRVDGLPLEAKTGIVPPAGVLVDGIDGAR